MRCLMVQADITQAVAIDFINKFPHSASIMLSQWPPSEIADFVKKLNQEDCLILLSQMLPADASQILLNIDLPQRVALLEQLDIEKITSILRYFKSSYQKEIFDRISPKKRSLISDILRYDKDTVGAWMNKQIFLIPEEFEVKSVIEKLKNYTYSTGEIYFVINTEKNPLGWVSLSELIKASEITPVSSIMKSIPKLITGSALLSNVINYSEWEQFMVLPVIDKNKVVIGDISYSRLLQASREFNPMALNEQNSTSPLVSILDAYNDLLVSVFSGISKQTSPKVNLMGDVKSD
jgi:magnesium transporter